MRQLFVLPKSVGGFHDYFKLTADTETVVGAFGFGFERGNLRLPRTTSPVAEIAAALRPRINSALHLVSMNSETPRREFLMAPVVLDLALATHAKLHSEYAIRISPLLHGSLDYFLEKEGTVVVVEAKHADMTRGFTQLCAEMIAVNEFADVAITRIYGAVTVGELWRFGVLDRAEKRVFQDISLFRVPDDLEELLSVLVGILNNEPIV